MIDVEIAASRQQYETAKQWLRDSCRDWHRAWWEWRNPAADLMKARFRSASDAMEFKLRFG